MNVAITQPWTVERFLAWAGRQEGRYEFDGFRPVAMTGGNVNHSRIMMNIHASLRARLRGTSCSCYGPDLGVLTAGEKVRYPDALVTCTRLPGTDLLATDVVVVFEVLSPESGRRDRIEKVRDYASVGSILRYVIVESTSAAVTLLHRGSGEEPFSVLPLTGEGVLPLPEIGTELPVAELHEDVAFEPADPEDAEPA